MKFPKVKFQIYWNFFYQNTDSFFMCVEQYSLIFQTPTDFPSCMPGYCLQQTIHKLTEYQFTKGFSKQQEIIVYYTPDVKHVREMISYQDKICHEYPNSRSYSWMHYKNAYFSWTDSTWPCFKDQTRIRPDFASRAVIILIADELVRIGSQINAAYHWNGIAS